MNPSRPSCADLERELERQEQLVEQLRHSIDPALSDQLAQLSDRILEGLNDAVGQLDRARPRPAIVFGLRA